MRRKGKLRLSAMACALALLAAATAGSVRADTVTSISLSGFHQMVVDTLVSPSYVFLSGGGSIVVTDLSGNLVTTIDSGDNVQGIALSPDGTTLYAALSQGGNPTAIGAITVSSIASTLAQTFFQLGTGNAPDSLAVQSGKLWVSYNNGSTTNSGAIGDIDPTTGTFTAQTTMGAWAAPPDLAADPSNTGVLVAVVPGTSPATAATFNTAGATVAPMAAQGPLGSTPTQCMNEHQVAVVPGGTQFIAACEAPQNEYVYNTADLTSPSHYGTGSGLPAGVAVDADGTVAVGTHGSPSAIYVYSKTGTLLNVFNLGTSSSLVANGLAWEDTTAGAQLAAMIETTGPTPSFSLEVFDQPTVTRSALTLTAPSSAVAGTTVTLTGRLTLSNSATLPTGTSVTITRSGPGATEQPQQVPLGLDGSFTLTDVPPTAGTYTYTANYAGVSQTTTAAQATASLTASLNTTKLTLTGPASVFIGKSVTLTGTLFFGTAPAPRGTPVTITRTSPGNPGKQVTVATGAGGTFPLTDTPPATGGYTYSAKYAGGPATTAATAAHAVSVVRIPVSLTVTTSGTTFTYQPTVGVTAHLGPTFRNRTVSIYAQWFGSKARTLLKTGTVNARGDLTVSYKAPHSTTFTVIFGGDPHYTPGTATRQVFVRARVLESISGFFGSRTVGGVLYRLFHATALLHAAASVAPDKAGQCVQFEVQEFFRGAWHPNASTPCVALSKSSQAAATFGLIQADLGFPYRIRADYIRRANDVTNLSADSGWLFFMVET